MEVELLHTVEMARRGLLGNLAQKIADHGRLTCHAVAPGFPRAGDSIVTATAPLIVQGLNAGGGNVTPAVTAGAIADGAALTNAPAMSVWLFNGTTFDRVRTNSGTNISNATQAFGQLIAAPGQWSQFQNPAANTQATTTKAAGGGAVRHVCQMLCFSLSNNAAAAANLTVVLRDGASGAGTILWSTLLAIPAVANSLALVIVPNLNIFGSPNTAMTAEFTAAGGANTLESASIAGYSTL